MNIKLSQIAIFTFVVFNMILYISCDDKPPETNQKTFDPGFIPIIKSITENRGITVTTIDTCQYIIMSGLHDYTIIHKQNCNNPNHKKHE